MIGMLAYLILFLLVGLGPFCSLLPALEHVNLLSGLALLVSLGWITFSLAVLTLGHFGGPISDTTLLVTALTGVVISVPMAALSNVGIRTFKRLTARAPIPARPLNSHFAPLSAADILVLLFLSTFFAFLIWINERIYTPAWDHFTYWLIDAKQIFETGHLRRDTRLTNVFPYSSYHPLQAVFLYLWYGDILEQTSSLINFLYAALASVLAYGAIRTTGWKTIAVGIAILIVNFSLVGQLCSFYADISTVFFFTLFFFLLVNVHFASDLNALRSRFWWLAVILMALPLIKSTNLFYIPCLLLMWIFHDLKEKRTKLVLQSLTTLDNVVCLIAVAGVLTGRLYYTTYVLLGDIEPQNLTPSSMYILDLEGHFIYGAQLFDFILTEYSLLSAALLITCGILLNSHHLSKRQTILAISLFLFPAINVAHYLIGQFSLQSRSLLRYMTTTYFLLPMVVSGMTLSFPATTKWSGRVKEACFGVLAFLLVVLIGGSLWVTFPYAFQPAHSGKYADFKFLRESALIAQRVAKRIKGADLLLATDVDDHYVSNRDLPSIQYRYFLSNNSVGGLYSIGKEYFAEFLFKLKPRFVLIQSFNDELDTLFPRKSKEPSTYPLLFRVRNVSPWSAVQVEY